jgi:hypothetical protein
MPIETDHDDFFDEMPTAVMLKHLIDEALAETEDDSDELETQELDPSEFRAIGTR